MTKICSKCQFEKDESVFRFKNKALNKRHGVCQECHSQHAKEYYSRDPEYHRQRARNWAANNIEHKRQRNTKYMQEYRQKHGERAALAIRNHYKNNSEDYKTRAKLRRDKEFGWVDSEFLEKVRTQFDNKCFKCQNGENLQFDHHTPLCDGGQLVPGNVTLLCGKCNNTKKHCQLYTDNETITLSKFHQEQISWFKPTDFAIEIGSNNDMLKHMHYLQTLAPTKHSFILTYKTRTVGVCTFGKPSRQNIKADLELSRFFVMDGTPKNTESYFLGGALRLLHKSGFRGTIISFADTTEGHQGTIYKASNWKFDGYTSKNYHYEKDGTRIHKRQVWDRAKKNNQKESEQALLEGLTKVEELPKSRWTYKII